MELWHMVKLNLITLIESLVVQWLFRLCPMSLSEISDRHERVLV